MRISLFMFLTLFTVKTTLTRTDAFFFPNVANNNYVKTTTKQLNRIPSNFKILILPGFGNDYVDYTMENSMVSSLLERGWRSDQIDVLPVARSDWLQVFWNGAFDWKFWVADASPTRPAFRWYLERISNYLSEKVKDDEKVILVGHSAGGWLGRAAIGFGSLRREGLSLSSSASTTLSSENKNDEAVGPPVRLCKIAGIVTLGAPNLPPPPGVMDMTRGALRITHERFPGAYHSPDVFYLTAMGLSVTGKKQQRTSPLEPTNVEGFAFTSYEAVCGDGSVIGDGVVPLCAGHLDEAVQLDLEGVLHSINAPENWYGSTGVLDRWHETMLEKIHEKTRGETRRLPLFSFLER